MNIGIMVSRQTPDAGGGFTFEDELLKAFFLRKEESPHRFFLFGHALMRPAHLDPTGLPWLSLRRSRSQRRGQKVRRLLERMKLRSRSRALDFESYPDFAAQPLDLICYLTPEVRPIADIPYLTVLWDLEHRIRPFFPEVSHYGEWEVRERRHREVLSRATFVLALNSHGKREVEAIYGIDPGRVRAVTLPTPSFALQEGQVPHQTRSLEHLGIRGEYLFYPAQFWAHKNHVCLLLALKILKERHGVQPQLVLTGSDKGNRAYIEQVVRDQGLTNQVVFPGFVAREDLISLYRQALALLFPSFLGPENIPPLEAFALGCPVIASDIPGHDEQLGDAAVRVDPTQPEQWAGAIQRLRADSAWRESLIARGKVRAQQNTPDDFVLNLFRLMDEFSAYRRCWASKS